MNDSSNYYELTENQYLLIYLIMIHWVAYYWYEKIEDIFSNTLRRGHGIRDFGVIVIAWYVSSRFWFDRFLDSNFHLVPQDLFLYGGLQRFGTFFEIYLHVFLPNTRISGRREGSHIE